MGRQKQGGPGDEVLEQKPMVSGHLKGPTLGIGTEILISPISPEIG